MKISTRARYAMRFMIDLAANGAGGPVILRDVARRQQISKRYLEQVAVTLRNANLVHSVQGRGGGYALPRPAKDIFVSEIMRATMGPINVVGCVVNPQICERSKACPSRTLWQRVNESIRGVLESVTLAELSEDGLSYINVDVRTAAPCSRSDTIEVT